MIPSLLGCMQHRDHPAAPCFTKNHGGLCGHLFLRMCTGGKGVEANAYRLRKGVRKFGFQCVRKMDGPKVLHSTQLGKYTVPKLRTAHQARYFWFRHCSHNEQNPGRSQVSLPVKDCYSFIQTPGQVKRSY
jgi:hypothetical protein